MREAAVRKGGDAVASEVQGLQLLKVAQEGHP